MVKLKTIISILLFLLFVIAETSCNTQKVFVSEPEKVFEINSGKKTTSKLATEIKKWLGVPYKYGGQTKSGVDCSGLVVELYKSVYNKKLYRSSYEIYERNCRSIKKSELKEGDLVFFITSNTGERINHVGLYLNDNKFVHSTTKRGVIISDLSESYYEKYFYRAGRVVTN